MDKQWEKIQQAALQRGLHIENPGAKTLASVRKIQKAVRTVQHKVQAIPLAQTLALPGGWFWNEDKTEATILDALVAGGQGVCLVNFSDIRDRVQEQVIISKQELAAVCPWSGELPMQAVQRIQLPVMDNKGGKAIIQALLFQFGEKHIKFGAQTEAPVTTETLVTTTFQVHKEHVGAAVWAELMGKPVKVLFASFQRDSIQSNIVRVWGRTWTRDREKVLPTEATKFHCYASVKGDALHGLLRQSGLNHVFMGPKADDGSPHPDFAVVWVSSRGLAENATRTCEDHLGIAYNNKNYGIRVMRAQAKDAHSLRHPDRQYNEQIPIKKVYKIAPTPRGLTPESLQHWALNLKWPIRPIKRLADSSWLVGTEQEAPGHFHTMSGAPVMISEVQQQGKRPEGPTIVVGSLTPTKATPATPDPWLQSDPWSAGRTAPLQTPAKVAHEQEKINTAQAERVQSMEDKMKTMEAAQAALQDQVNKLHTGVNGKFLEMEQKVATRIDQQEKRWHESLTTALAEQDRRSDASFEELKEMIRGLNKRTAGTPQKEHKTPKLENGGA